MRARRLGMLGVRVLIVDDMPAVREGLRLLLGSEPDLEIVGEAGNGHDALRLTEMLHPDVVLLDIEMPGTDSLSVTREIKRHPHPPLIVAMTTYSDDQTCAQALEAGADQFIEKNISPDEVAIALRMANVRTSSST